MRPLITVSLLVLVAASLAGCASTIVEPAISYGETSRFVVDHDFMVDVPEGARQVRVWFAVPSNEERAQAIGEWNVEVEVDVSHRTRIVRDELGNRFLFLEVDSPPAGEFAVRTGFLITRSEVSADLDPARTRPHTEAELAKLAQHLEGSSMSVIDTNARTMARTAVGSERNPVLASRRIYDAILDHMEYHVKDPKPDAEKTMSSTGTGSSVKAYETRCGNCTDFHSLYAAVSRAAGIPTRVVYGSFFKGPLDGVDRDQSYHCWIEFHAPNIGWVPLDVAVADVFVEDFVANENSRPRADLTVADGYEGADADLVDYYFGNLESRRVTWHYGRDLVMKDPRQAGPPLLWNPKAYGEADGEPLKIARKLTYRQEAGPGMSPVAAR